MLHQDQIQMKIKFFHQFHFCLYIHHSIYLYIKVGHIVDVNLQSIYTKKKQTDKDICQNIEPN
jgi:hypothetical protein